MLRALQQKYQHRVAGNNTSQNRLRATQLEENVLDTTALLFAKVKLEDGQRGNVPILSPQHVTATAMRKTSDNIRIYVAKNDGAQLGDEAFR